MVDQTIHHLVIEQDLEFIHWILVVASAGGGGGPGSPDSDMDGGSGGGQQGSGAGDSIASPDGLTPTVPGDATGGTRDGGGGGGASQTDAFKRNITTISTIFWCSFSLHIVLQSFILIVPCQALFSKHMLDHLECFLVGDIQTEVVLGITGGSGINAGVVNTGGGADADPSPGTTGGNSSTFLHTQHKYQKI